MGNSRLRDCNLQSGVVLWLRHSFARAFFEDSLLVDCFASLAMTIGKTSLRFQIKPNQILTSTLGLLGYTRGLLILRILLVRESESLFALSSVDFDSALDSVLESSL